MMSIKCGHCKGTHDTIVEVRRCSTRDVTPADVTAAQRAAEASVARGNRRFGGASDSQISYVKSLLEKRDLTGTAFPDWDDTVLGGLTSNEASKAIDFLKSLPYAKRSSEATKTSGPIVPLEDAMYLKDGKIFKVYHTVHGANQQVAKELVPLPESDWYTKEVRGKEVTVKAEFEYRGKAPLHGLTAEHRMTREQAIEFGAIYGVCVNCGATLTAEVSIERSMGPVCYSKFAA